MPSRCLKCDLNGEKCPRIVRCGRYFRTSDGKWVQRFKCRVCGSGFSNAIFQKEYRQKKRSKNALLRKLFTGGMAQRKIARDFNLNRKTVARKLLFLGMIAEWRLKTSNLGRKKATTIEFDDLETFEHTKCKPISVTLAVEFKTRRILGLEVSSMPAKGKLVEKAKKYGFRQDTRRAARRKLFGDLRELVAENALIKSDSNPHYPPEVKEFFPGAKHQTYLSRKGSLGGQGELKRVAFDPLFSLNHTCAMFRAHVNRLIRKTWCTTKKIECLRAHLLIYACYHNENLKS